LPNRKKQQNSKFDSFIRFGVTKDQKMKIIKIAEETNKSLSEFIRDAIFEKIRNIEYPEQATHIKTSYIPQEILEQIMLKAEKIIELQEEANKRLRISQDIEETRMAIKQEYEKLRNLGKINDLSKEANLIFNLLNGHKSLTPDQISKKTNLDIEKVFLILQVDNRFKLNITTGRYELR